MDDDSIKTASDGEKGMELNLSNIPEDYENIPSLTELEGEILFDNSEDMIELIDITDSPEEDEAQMEIPSQQSDDENQSTPLSFTEEVVVTCPSSNGVNNSKSDAAIQNLYDILASDPTSQSDILKTTLALGAPKPPGGEEKINNPSSTVTCSDGNVIWPKVQETPANNDFRRHDLTVAQLKNILTFCPVCRKCHASHHEVSRCLFENNKKLCWLCLDVINSKAVEEYYWHCVKNHLISSGLFVDCPYCVLSFDYRQGINYHIATEHFNESPGAFFDFFNGQLVKVALASSEHLMLLQRCGQVGSLWSENEERLNFQQHEHDPLNSETPHPGEQESNSSKFTLFQAPTISLREREVESPFLLHSLKKPPGYMPKDTEFFRRDTANLGNADNKNGFYHNIAQSEEIIFNDKLFLSSESHIFPVNTAASITTLTTSSPLYRLCTQEQGTEKKIEIDTHFDNIELSNLITRKNHLTKHHDMFHVQAAFPSNFVSCVIQSSTSNEAELVYLSNIELDYGYSSPLGEMESGNQTISVPQKQLIQPSLVAGESEARAVGQAREIPMAQLSPAIIQVTLGSPIMTTGNSLKSGNNVPSQNQIQVPSTPSSLNTPQTQNDPIAVSIISPALSLNNQNMSTSHEYDYNDTVDTKLGESQDQNGFCSQTTQTQGRRSWTFTKRNIRRRTIRGSATNKTGKIPVLVAGMTPKKGSQAGPKSSRHYYAKEVSSHAVVRDLYAGVLSLSSRQGLPEKISRSKKTNGEGNFISKILKLVGDDSGQKDVDSADVESINDDKIGGERENTIQNSNSEIMTCPRQTETLQENYRGDTRKIQRMEADTPGLELTVDGDKTIEVNLEGVTSTSQDAPDKLEEILNELDEAGNVVVNENNLAQLPVAPFAVQVEDSQENDDARAKIPVKSDVKERKTEEIPEEGVQKKESISNEVNCDVMDRIKLEMAAIHDEAPPKTVTVEHEKPDINLRELLIKEFRARKKATNSSTIDIAEQDPGKMKNVRQNDNPGIQNAGTKLSKPIDTSENDINTLTTKEHSNLLANTPENQLLSPKNPDPDLKLMENDVHSNYVDKQFPQSVRVDIESSSTTNTGENDIYDKFRNLEKECRQIQLKLKKQKKLRLINAQTQQQVQITQPNTSNQITHPTKNNESILPENASDQTFQCSISKQGHLLCQKESDNVSGYSTNDVNTATAIAVVGAEKESNQAITSKRNLTRDSAQEANTGSFQNIGLPVTEFHNITTSNTIHGGGTNGCEQTSSLPSRKHYLQFENTFSEIKRCLLNRRTQFDTQNTYNHSQEFGKFLEPNENEMRESQSDCWEKTVQMVQGNPMHETLGASSHPTQFSSIHSANFTKPSTNFRFAVPTPTPQHTRAVTIANACHPKEQVPRYPPNIPCQNSNSYGENKSSSNISPTEFNTGMKASSSFSYANSPTLAKFNNDMHMECLNKATEQNGRSREWIFDDPVAPDDIQAIIESRRIEATSQNTNCTELLPMMTTSTTTTPWKYPRTPSSSWRANTNVTETHRQVCMNALQRHQVPRAGIARGHLQGNPIRQERNPRCIKPQVNSGAVPNLPESCQINCASAIHSGNSSKFEQFGSSLHVANSYADACKMPQSSGGVMRFDDFQNRDHPRPYPHVPRNLHSANSSGKIDLAIRPMLLNRLRERHMMPMIEPQCQRHEQPQRPADNQHEVCSDTQYGDIGHNGSNYSSSLYSYHPAPEPMTPQNYGPYQIRQAPPYPRRHTVEWRTNGRQNNMEDTFPHLHPRILNSHFQCGHHSMQQLHSFTQQQYPKVQQQNMQFPGACGMSMQQFQQNRTCLRQQYYQQLHQRQHQHLQHRCTSVRGNPPIAIAPQYAEQCHRMMHQLHHNSINHSHRGTY